MQRWQLPATSGIRYLRFQKCQVIYLTGEKLVGGDGRRPVQRLLADWALKNAFRVVNL
jgi:hypothetical protein